MTRPFLSACFMVKDEAANIAEAIASLKGVAEDICILDTGSTDDTVRIARHATIENGFLHSLRRSEWKGFAESRNESLSFATGEWILIMDGDERLHSAGDLLELLHGVPGDVDMVAFNHRCVGNALNAGDVPMVRVFRGDKVRDGTIKYVFPVHAQAVGWRKYAHSTALTIEPWDRKDSVHSAERSIPVLLDMLAAADAPSLVRSNGQPINADARKSCRVHARRFLAKSYGLLADAAEDPEEKARNFLLALDQCAELLKVAPDDPYAWLVAIGIESGVSGLMGGAVGPLVHAAMLKFPKLMDLHWWSMRLHAASLVTLGNAGDDYALTPQRHGEYMPHLKDVERFLSMKFNPA